MLDSDSLNSSIDAVIVQPAEGYEKVGKMSSVTFVQKT